MQEEAEKAESDRQQMEGEAADVREQHRELITRTNAMLYELLEKNSTEFFRKVCTYITADTLPKDDPILNLWGVRDMRSNYRDIVRGRFRFLADETLALLSGQGEPDSADVYSLYEFARSEMRSHIRLEGISFRFTRDRTDLTDPSQFLWDFFNSVREGLDLALSVIADFARYGLPFYEYAGDSLSMLSDDDERASFLRLSAKLGGLYPVYEPPSWTRSVVIKKTEHRLAGWIFSFENVPSEKEVSERRRIFRSQLGLPEFVSKHQATSHSPREPDLAQGRERGDGLSLPTALKIIGGLIAVLKARAVVHAPEKSVSQEVIQQWLMDMFPNRLPVDRQLDAYFAAANRALKSGAE